MPKAAHCCWREPSALLRTGSEALRATPGCRKMPVDSNGFESAHERDNLSSLDCACSLLHSFSIMDCRRDALALALSPSLISATCGLLRRRRHDHFDVQRDVHIVADHYATAIQVLVPNQAKVFAIYLGGA